MEQKKQGQSVCRELVEVHEVITLVFMAPSVCGAAVAAAVLLFCS